MSASFVRNVSRCAAKLRHQHALTVAPAYLAERQRFVPSNARGHRDQTLRARTSQLRDRSVEIEHAEIEICMSR
jgi:hypothetical protein